MNIRPATINFDQVLVNNWNPDYHKNGVSVPIDARMFGLVIFDWDGKFKRRIRRYKRIRDLTIPFQYIEQIPNWSKSANYADVGDIMGRYEPISIYTNSGAQEFQLSLFYAAESLNTNKYPTDSKWSLEFIEQLCMRIKSLVFPQYDGSYGPPVRLLLNIGNIYRDVPVIVKQVNIENQPPYHHKTGYSLIRKVTIDCRVSYPLWQSIKANEIWAAYEGNVGRDGPDIFAIAQLPDKYKTRNRRSRYSALGQQNPGPFNA